MNNISSFIEEYGSLVIAPILYFEALGAPLPGETGLIAASLAAASGKISLPLLLIAGFIGSVLGDCTGYLIGRYGGHALLLKIAKWLKIKPERIEEFEKKVNEKGFYFVFFARFIVVLRQLNGIISGSTHMKFSKFLTANCLGAAAWVLVWGAGPYLITKLF